MPGQARMDHNARIKADIDAAAPRRAAFLAGHLDTLAPFITPQVAAQIRCAPATDATPASAPLPQPTVQALAACSCECMVCMMLSLDYAL